jgi:pyruvate ferredoxin oxidoreductase alpha subunit
MSVVIGASLAGARTFTATSSQGLLLMYEELYAASGMRLPIVMALAARALSSPINIHNDHQDFFSMRDSGWIMLNGEEAQETYDLTLMAFCIAENQNVLLPAVVSYDGFIVSHAISNLYCLSNEEVEKFVGNRKYGPMIDPDHPRSFGVLALQDSYMEFKKQQFEAMNNSKEVIRKVFEDYSDLSGRHYGPFKEFMTEDAETCLVALGSTVGTARHAASVLREEGEKVGVVGITQYRPWPAEEAKRLFSKFNNIVVMEKTLSPGAKGGPVYEDITSTLFSKCSIPIVDFIYGLGGRDVSTHDITELYRKAKRLLREGQVETPQFYGVRE